MDYQLCFEPHWQFKISVLSAILAPYQHWKTKVSSTNLAGQLEYALYQDALYALYQEREKPRFRFPTLQVDWNMAGGICSVFYLLYTKPGAQNIIFLHHIKREKTKVSSSNLAGRLEYALRNLLWFLSVLHQTGSPKYYILTLYQERENHLPTLQVDWNMPGGICSTVPSLYTINELKWKLSNVYYQWAEIEMLYTMNELKLK